MAVKRNMNRVGKSCNYTNDVLVVNGWEGTGKTGVVSVLRELKGIEPARYSYQLEWYCSYWMAGEIDRETAVSMIKSECDLIAYNSVYGRELNWRLRDISSVSNHPNWWKYFQRGLRNDIDESTINDCTCINLITHNLLPCFGLIKEALGDRLTFIEVVRDPLFMLNQSVFNQRECYQRSKARDFTLRFRDTDMPIFDGRAAKGLCSFPEVDDMVEQAIDFLERRFRVLFETGQEDGIIYISFEDFVKSPYRDLARVSDSVGRVYNSTLKRRLRSEKIPRSHHDDGKNTRDYKRVGWKKIEGSSGYATETERFLSLYEAQGFKRHSLDRLVHLSKQYQKWKGSRTVL